MTVTEEAATKVIIDALDTCPKATTLQIVCCVCLEHKGEKDGHGTEGITSTICEPCALTLLPPELHDRYRRLKALELEGV
jgi:hypothetical protein